MRYPAQAKRFRTLDKIAENFAMLWVARCNLPNQLNLAFEFMASQQAVEIGAIDPGLGGSTRDLAAMSLE